MIRGLMTDDEWAIVAPFLIIPSLRGGRPPANHRAVLDGVFWINRTGAPWRDLPEAFGNWNSHRLRKEREKGTGLREKHFLRAIWRKTGAESLPRFAGA